ncbi:MAG TPA: MopE-related protein [Chitinophagales bacterium]|nr:MopE-related protein [Chitinophagales bacterium]
MIKKLVLGIHFSLAIIFCVNAQDIPEERISDWSKAGHQTAIPEFKNILNILDYGGSKNGSADNVAAFNSAIKAAIPGTTIFFPSGQYAFSNTINITKDSIIIKGEGVSTQLLFNLNGVARNLIQIQGAQINTDRWITESIENKQDYVIVNQAQAFAPEQWVTLIANDSSIMESNWAYNTGGQILQIKNIVEDTLFFKSSFRRSHAMDTEPRLKIMTPRKYVGIENLYIERVDAVDAQTTNMFFKRAVNSWIIGVESNMTNASHATFMNSSNMTLRGSYFHHSHSYGNGGRGYGIVIEYTSGECLIENNMFNNLRHSVLMQAGANGNVIGYNYSINPYWTDVTLLPANSAGDIVLHGNYPYSNLIEGNSVQQIVIDDSHGINGSYNTIFRNKMSGYGFLINNGAGNSSNILGNDITSNGFLMGLYTLNGSDHYQYGNRVKGANSFKPNGTKDLTTESYYLCSSPKWWNNETWPNIGAPYSYNSTQIPAENRWSNSKPLSYHSDLRNHLSDQTPIWYKDADNDGYGDPNEMIAACSAPIGYVSNAEDCDDTDASIYPGATEIPNDGIDQDCNGEDLILTGINNIIKEQFKIYPNPSKGLLWLETDDIKEDTYKLIITDISGRTVQYFEELNITNNLKTQISIDQPGVYIIQLKGTHHHYHQNVIIF